jgi:PKD repeat protein
MQIKFSSTSKTRMQPSSRAPRRRVRIFRTISLIAALTAFFGHAIAADVTLAWDPVSSSQLGGYELQYRLASGSYDKQIDVGNQTSATVSALEAGKTYQFRVRAYSKDKGIWSGFSNEVSKTLPAVAPVADFSVDKTSGEAPLTVFFSDASSGDITGRTWQFGDGTSATDAAMVTHTYSAPGTYSVQLSVSGPGGTDAEVKTNFMVVQAPPTSGENGTAGAIEPSDPADPGDGSTDDGSTDGATLAGGIIEVGEIELDHEWRRVEFKQPFIDPVVIVKPLSANDDDPAVVRVDGVDAEGFTARIQEWDYLDGTHGLETVSYLVIEQGQHQLPDGSWLEAGLLDTDATASFIDIGFAAPFTQTPVVLAAVTTYNGSDTVTTRLRNIDATGFQIKMQEQEKKKQQHIVETLAFLAWEPSSGAIDGWRFEVDRTSDAVTHASHTIGFTTAFEQAPVFLADMQSTDGNDTANLRWLNKDALAVDVWVDEEQSRNSETSHTTETVGYLAIEADVSDDPADDVSDDTSGSTSSGLNEGFEGYATGAQPTDWTDTAAGNSMSEKDSLFKVMDLGGERVFGTSSTETNIHSHYTGTALEGLSAYEYMGRMMVTDASSSVGVTFFSDYPQRDAYYRLRSYSGNSFHIAPHPHGENVLGDIETGVAPAKNVWYRYRIQIEDTGSVTEIRAKVWADNQSEPANWQVQAYDNSATRLKTGTVGLWSMGRGNKYWDDVSVTDLSP